MFRRRKFFEKLTELLKALQKLRETDKKKNPLQKNLKFQGEPKTDDNNEKPNKIETSELDKDGVGDKTETITKSNSTDEVENDEELARDDTDKPIRVDDKNNDPAKLYDSHDKPIETSDKTDDVDLELIEEDIDNNKKIKEFNVNKVT